jgi:hypothetical protein
MLSKTKVTLGASLAALASLHAAQNVIITDVPDYTWHAGCFGSASGNMMGYWDRHGFPNFYTGPTAGGVAPLNSNASNVGIRSLWASQAGFDGRPADQPGHIEDYWNFYNNEVSMSYESTAPDPYVTAGRAEHVADCISDFMGSSQNKWTNLAGECSGNIDAFAFNFWDKTGAKRFNYRPPDQNGIPVRDIQSGWRHWTESRGSRAEVYSQLVDFNPEITPGTGFTFEELKKEIDSGYPVMLFLQNYFNFSRNLAGMPNGNPIVHGMIAYGYIENDDGTKYVRYRTSWGSGNNVFAAWTTTQFEAGLSLRGVVVYHPQPKITSITPSARGFQIKWEGPASMIQPFVGATAEPAHFYVLEKSSDLSPDSFLPVTEMLNLQEVTVPNETTGNAYYRIKLVNRTELPSLP